MPAADCAPGFNTPPGSSPFQHFQNPISVTQPQPSHQQQPDTVSAPSFLPHPGHLQQAQPALPDPHAALAAHSHLEMADEDDYFSLHFARGDDPDDFLKDGYNYCVGNLTYRTVGAPGEQAGPPPDEKVTVISKIIQACGAKEKKLLYKWEGVPGLPVAANNAIGDMPGSK